MKKILKLITNNKLNFKSHINELCKKASETIGALCRLSSYLNNYQKKVIFNSIIKAQFSYCPLLFMFCSSTLSNMINKLHERSIIVVLNGYSSDFNELLESHNGICNHHRNIQSLIEVFKVKNELSPPIMESMLNKRVHTYNLTNFQKLVTSRKRTVWTGLETLSYRYPQLFSLLSESLKEANSLSELKRNIRH